MGRFFPTVRPRIGVSSTDMWLIGVVVAIELLLVAVYFLTTGAQAIRPRYVLYPFVWINVGIWAVWKVSLPRVDPRSRWIAVGISGAYFLLLCVVAGLISLQGVDDPHAGGVRLLMASPGWGPAVVYADSAVRLAAVPYLLIGYLSLAYLVYAAIADVASAAASGLLGFASCVGCAFPVVASLVAGVAGGSSALTAAVYALSIDLSTVVFVFAVALLYWRPGFGGTHASHSSQ